jgi:hypothetical protein
MLPTGARGLPNLGAGILNSVIKQFTKIRPAPFARAISELMLLHGSDTWSGGKLGHLTQ